MGYYSDYYYITPAGARFLSCPRHLCKPVPLSRHTRFPPDAEPDSLWTRFELVTRLQQQGWDRVALPNSAPKKTEPYRSGSPKIYYHHLQSNGGLYKEYLLVLSKAERLFASGLAAIHFYQLKAYYVACLELLALADDGTTGIALPALRPNQPASFYKLLLQQRSGRRQRVQADHASGGVPSDDEGVGLPQSNNRITTN